MSTDLTLPKEKIPVKNNNPRSLLLYGAPKIGKTTVASGIDDNLILDIEGGSEYVEALKMDINSPKKLSAVLKKIKSEDKPYRFTTLDTITELENWAEKRATIKHKKNNPGFQGNIKELAYGLGYAKIRDKFKSMLSKFRESAEHNILVAHVKDKYVDGEEESQVASKEIDLTGKLKAIVTSSVDAIGYMRINPDNKNQRLLSFKTDENVTCGNRCSHLEGEEFVISEKKKDGTVETNWDKVYVD